MQLCDDQLQAAVLQYLPESLRGLADAAPGGTDPSGPGGMGAFPMGAGGLAGAQDQEHERKSHGLPDESGFWSDEDGDWEFGLNIGGFGNMYVDGKLFISIKSYKSPEDAFFLLGSPDIRKVLTGLKAGEPHKIEIRIGNAELVAAEPIFKYRGGIRLGAIRKVEDEQAIQDAVTLAKGADGKWLAWTSRHLLIAYSSGDSGRRAQ